MGEIRRYTPADAAVWDAFVAAAKNGTFLFRRAYMDYHSERFADHSLMYYSARGALLSLLPANLSRDDDSGSLTLHSHQGLTYGGFILAPMATTDDVMDMFRQTIAYLRAHGIRAFYYKQVPVCYHRYPAQEDDYALWRCGAALVACGLSSTLALTDSGYKIPLQYRRRRGIARATKQGYTVRATTDLVRFWEIMEANLRERYHTAPVHTLQEMRLLMTRFPDNICCFVAERDGQSEAGVIVYLCPPCVHTQYIQSSPQGRADGAVDLLLSTLIAQYAAQQYQYFDFGISTEEGGRILNSNLIAQKEGFGARGTVYKQWRLSI